ncbi:MAG: class I SAM-dependent methyltransferase [Anaerolineaceae bacterium]|nr:class I SAM-dependent methyltransferase [Anaerolineaceae bacterium]
MASSQNNNDDIDINFFNLRSFNCFKTSQNKTEITYLLNLLKNNEYKTICEIGSYRGGSFYLFCQVAPDDATLISVDIEYPIERKHAHRKFGKKGQKLFCIRGDTKDASTYNKVKNALHGQQLDLLFIDGDHSLFGVMNDFIRYAPLVRQKGIIAFHDIKSNLTNNNKTDDSTYVGDVPLFWQMIKDTSGIQTKEIIENPKQNGYGIGIIIKDF